MKSSAPICTSAAELARALGGRQIGAAMARPMPGARRPHTEPVDLRRRGRPRLALLPSPDVTRAM